MSKSEHVLIRDLKRDLSQKRIGRREFIRYSTLLGMSAGAAYMWAGKITGEPIAAPAQAQDLPKGGVVRIAMRVPKIDSPHTYSWIYDSNILRQVCGYLTRTGVDNVTRPHLFSKWKASPDLKTWTFTTAAKKWRKTGEPFTAEQAAWNIRHCLDAKVGSSVIGLMKGYMLKDVDTGTKDDKGNPVMTTELWDANAIEVKNAETLVLNLKEPQVAVPEHLFHYPFGIVDLRNRGCSASDRTEPRPSNSSSSKWAARPCCGLSLEDRRISMRSISSTLATIPRRLRRPSHPNRSMESISAMSSSWISIQAWPTSNATTQ